MRCPRREGLSARSYVQGLLDFAPKAQRAKPTMDSTISKIKSAAQTLSEGLGISPPPRRPAASEDESKQQHLQKERREPKEEVEHEEAPRKKAKAGQGDTILVPKKAMLNFQHKRELLRGWVDTFSCIDDMDTHLENLADLPSNVPDAGFRTEREKVSRWNTAAKGFHSAFNELKVQSSHNVRTLVPAAVEAVSRAEELQAQNGELAAASNEAASKLQATQVALHMSSAGHADIGSTFPLSLEIAAKVTAFGSSDEHNELVLEHVIGRCKTMEVAGGMMFLLHQYASSTVLHSVERTESKTMGALGLASTPMIDGFMRKCAPPQFPPRPRRP